MYINNKFIRVYSILYIVSGVYGIGSNVLKILYIMFEKTPKTNQIHSKSSWLIASPR